MTWERHRGGGAPPPFGRARRPHGLRFRHTEFSRSIWPELTTIRQPIAEMSRSALLLLLKRIKARREHREEDCKHTLLDFTLVRRDRKAAEPLVLAPNVAMPATVRIHVPRRSPSASLIFASRVDRFEPWRNRSHSPSRGTRPQAVPRESECSP